MYTIRPIRSEEDYEAACARIRELMGAQLDTPEGDELDVLADLVEHYEGKHYPVGMPTAVDAIEFRIDQAGLTRRDLIPLIGSRQKVSDILTGKRDITMSMARALHKHLGIPADVLLQEPGAAFDSTFDEIDSRRFPLKEMAKRGWFSKLTDLPDPPHLLDRAEELINALVEKAGGPQAADLPLYRKNGHRRINAKTDPYALKAWCWRVLGQANETSPQARYRPGTVTEPFMREVAQLSVYEDGPRRAQRASPRTASPSSSSATSPAPISTAPLSASWTVARSSVSPCATTASTTSGSASCTNWPTSASISTATKTTSSSTTSP